MINIHIKKKFMNAKKIKFKIIQLDSNINKFMNKNLK